MFNKKRIKELEKEIEAKEELLDKQRAVLETQLREIESLRKHILKAPIVNECVLDEEHPLTSSTKLALLKECMGTTPSIFSFDDINLISFDEWVLKLNREFFYNGIKHHRKEIVAVLDEMKLSEIKDYFYEELFTFYREEREKHITFLNGLVVEAMNDRIKRRGK